MKILGDGLIFLGVIRKNGEPVFDFGLQIAEWNGKPGKLGRFSSLKEIRFLKPGYILYMSKKFIGIKS